MESHELDIQGTIVLEKNLKATGRIVRNEGSSRSSKSTSIAQTFVIKGLQETGKIFTISRKTRPALKASAEKDYLDLLIQYGLYNSDDHNKTEGTYSFRGNLVYFLAVDQATKLKSRKHNYIWMNEADEFDYDDFVQFNLRLSAPSNDGKRNQLFMDYNPTDEDHFIYTQLDGREDVTDIQSDFYDNGFLDEDTIREIERLKDTDPEYWLRYGLGLRVKKGELIYPKYIRTYEFPDVTEWTYGLDFGFNHPLALVKCCHIDGLGTYWKEEIYKSYLSPTDILAEMDKAGISREMTIYADPSRPDLISLIASKGYDIVPAENQVYEGILKVKSAPLYITEDSPNLIKEAKKYSWKKNPKTGIVSDVPIKIFDDGMDAGRYGSWSLINDQKIIKAPRTRLIRRNT